MLMANLSINHLENPAVKRSARWIRLALALVGAILLGDAVALMGMGLFNFGIVLPGSIGIAFLLLALCWDGVARWRKADRRRQLLWRAGWIAFGAWLVTVAMFFYGIRGGMGVAVPAVIPVRGIVILGSGTPNCKASPTLIARLDQGLVQAQRWPEAKVVVSGGQDFGLRCTEADIMADYLVARGVAADRVIREGRSTSTEENLLFSRRLLEEQGVDPGKATVVVTSDFHVRRAVGIARKAGFSEAFGVGAETPLYLRFNAWLREYFAAISSWILREY
ncbi:YdcF family protein [Cupriavidus necator]|uniref:YdcF family protein n=1 Tax=Cupriavidus necator TaxID=106590 RepID=UPI00148FCC85|nr:YdcF family protein [Cupriavidus necator]NOV25992.1 YdcF family protein [Cupriavidus necator]